MKKMLTNHWPILMLLVVGIYLSFPFFSNQLIAGHDTEVHGVRLANYYLAIKQGQIPPQWAPNMNYGFGYPVFVYSYHLPYILGTLPFVFNNSIEQSLNFLFVLSIFLAIFGAYFLAKVHDKSNFFSFIVSIIYVLSPYFLLTIYIRGAVAEALFLGLLPITFSFLAKKVINSFIHILLFYLTVSSLLLSHHVALIVFLPLAIGYLLIAYLTSKRDGLVQIRNKLLIVVLAILSTGFYWIPALISSKLIEVYGNSFTDASSGFLKASQLFWGLWDCKQYCYSFVSRPVPTFLGITSISILVLSSFLLTSKKTNNNNKIASIYWLSVSLICLFLMNPLSFNIWNKLPIIGMIEFPWLLLWVPTLAAMFCFIYIEKTLLKKRLVFTVLLSIFIGQSVFAIIFWTPPSRSLYKHKVDWLEFGDITQNYDGLLPKIFDSHKNLKLSEQVVVRLDGSNIYDDIRQEKPNNHGLVEILDWTGTRMMYKVNSTQSATIIQKTAYFPGWSAKVDGISEVIKSDDREFPGRITIDVSEGDHILEITYLGNMPSQIFGKTVSLFGFLGFAAYLLKYKHNYKLTLTS